MVWVLAWVLAIPGDLVMNLPLAGDGIDDTWFVLVVSGLVPPLCPSRWII